MAIKRVSRWLQQHRVNSIISERTSSLHCVCVCVCVFFFPSILDIKFVGRTIRGHIGYLIHLLSAVRALIFLAGRIQPFLSLVDREVDFFCVLTIQSFSTCWSFLYIHILFGEEKSQSPGVEFTSHRVRRLRGYQLSYRGDLYTVHLQ